MLCFLMYFLKNCEQRVVLKIQFSFWKKLNAGVPHGSILGHLLLLIYINDLLYGLQTNLKLFVDDTSLFSTGQDITTSTVSLNNDLKSLNRQYNGKWILILILAYKPKSYYLAKKQLPNHTRHWILMTIPFTKFNSKST